MRFSRLITKYITPTMYGSSTLPPTARRDVMCGAAMERPEHNGPPAQSLCEIRASGGPSSVQAGVAFMQEGFVAADDLV